MKRLLAIAGAVSGLVLVALPAAAYERPSLLERITVAGAGGDADASAANPSMSADGRVVVFTSAAGNLVEGDTNGQVDVFVRDLVERRTERVSLAADGSERRGLFGSPDVSGDGRFVSFWSSAALIADDVNAAGDVYLFDRLTRRLELASRRGDGTPIAHGASEGHISADARYVSFATSDPTLTPGDANASPDVYVRDRLTGTLELASATPEGLPANGEAFFHDLSDDGRHVVFQSDADDLVVDDTNKSFDVFVRDLDADRTRRASVSSAGVEGNSSSFLGYAHPISADGSVVAFISYASNLVPGDMQPLTDIYVHDSRTATTTRVSVGSGGQEPDSSSFAPTLSPDGRYVGFTSHASNFDARDRNAHQDYFLHDRLTGATELVSIGARGEQATTGYVNVESAISRGGQRVAFALEGALEAEDGNGVYDVYVRDRGPDLGVSALQVRDGGESVTVSGSATFSGAVVLERADATDDAAVADIVPAAALGGELTGVQAVHRPEREDLMLRWQVAELPAAHAPPGVLPGGSLVSAGLAPGLAGTPALTYLWQLSVDGVRYEVRVARVGVLAAPPAAPFAAAYRCAPMCVEVARVPATVGGTGDEVRAAVPLTALGAASGASISSSLASVVLAEPNSPVRSVLDVLALPAADVTLPTLHVALVPAGSPPDEVRFDTAAHLFEGRFRATVASDGSAQVWAKACLYSACAFSSAPVVADAASP